MKSLTKEFISTAKIIILGLVVGIGINIVSAAGSPWTPPASGCVPPDCNVWAPLNVSTADQRKDGALYIGTFLNATEGYFGSIGIGVSRPQDKLEINGTGVATDFCLTGKTKCLSGTSGGATTNDQSTWSTRVYDSSASNFDSLNTDSVTRSAISIANGAQPTGPYLLTLQTKVSCTSGSPGNIAIQVNDNPSVSGFVSNKPSSTFDFNGAPATTYINISYPIFLNSTYKVLWVTSNNSACSFGRGIWLVQKI